MPPKRNGVSTQDSGKRKGKGASTKQKRDGPYKGGSNNASKGKSKGKGHGKGDPANSNLASSEIVRFFSKRMRC